MRRHARGPDQSLCANSSRLSSLDNIFSHRQVAAKLDPSFARRAHTRVQHDLDSRGLELLQGIPGEPVADLGHDSRARVNQDDLDFAWLYRRVEAARRLAKSWTSATVSVPAKPPPATTNVSIDSRKAGAPTISAYSKTSMM